MKNKILVLAVLALMVMAFMVPPNKDNLKVFESGWLWVEPRTTLPIDHNMNALPVDMQILIAIETDNENPGSGIPYTDYGDNCTVVELVNKWTIYFRNDCDELLRISTTALFKTNK